MSTKSKEGRFQTWALISGVALMSLVLKASLLSLDAFPFNADEAVVGLMARHILQGNWPVFFYGQAYMGSLDATIVALGFMIFGQKVLVIRVVQALLFAGTLISTMLLGSEIVGKTNAALFAGLLMAIPPINVTLYTTVSLGGYGETLLIGNLLLLITLRIHKGDHARWLYPAWGFLAGIGFWAFGLTVIYIVPTAFFIFRAIWRDKPSRKNVIIVGSLLLAGIIGAAPWIYWAVVNGPLLLVNELAGSAIAGASPANPVSAVQLRLMNLLLFGTTVSIGLRPPWEIRWLALPLLPIALVFWLAVLGHSLRTLRGDEQLRTGHRMLFLIAGLLVIGFVLTPFGADPSGRYFVPIYIPLALFAADLLTHLERNWNRVVPLAILAIVLGFNLWGTLDAALRKPPGITTQFNAVTWIDHNYDNDLINFLHRVGEHAGHTNYWVAYPLAFLSSEELIFIPSLPYHLDFRYTSRDNRYEPYDRVVSESPRVAYITTNHPELNEQLRSAFRALGGTWKEHQIGDYHIFYELSRRVHPPEIGLGITYP